MCLLVIKVKSSLVFKPEMGMPTDIIFDIPEEVCNRKDWNDFIKEGLLAILNDRIKVEYELIE